MDPTEEEFKRYKASSELRIKALEATNLANAQKAEKTDRESRVRSELLGKYQFANDKALETAVKIFGAQVQRTYDGALEVNSLPFETFIATELPTHHSYLLAPKDVATARPGKSPGSREWDLDRDLLPENYSKLTGQEKDELRQYIGAAVARG